MTSFGKLTRRAGILAVSGALFLTNTSAFAARDKCQAAVEKEGAKLQKAIYGALAKCKDLIQKEVTKGILTGLGTGCQPGGGCMPTAAKGCEGQLAGVYDVLNAKPGKSKVAKFRAGIEKARQPNGKGVQVCTDADMDIETGLGHLLSGTGPHAGAPPASDAPTDTDGDFKADPNGHAKFMTDWLLFAIEKVVIKQQLFQVPEMLSLLSAAATTGPGPIVAGVASKKGTSCSTTFDANTEEYRPNLCRFGVECRDHACTLAQNGVCSQSAGACDPFGAACPGGPNDVCVAQNSYASLESAPLDSLSALGPVRLALGGRLVTEICRPGKTSGTCKTGGGACNRDADCTGANAPPCNMFPGLGAGAAFGAEPNFVYLINEVSRTLKAPQPPISLPPFNSQINAACVEIVRSEGWCDCVTDAASAHVNFTTCQDHIATGTTTDSCGASTDPSNTDSTYPGTVDGKLTLSTGGTSGAGDCVDLLSVSIKILQTAADKGPDGLPCTDDDFSAPLDPIAVPGTTGVANAVIKHAVDAAGACNGGLNNNSPCIENANCPGGTCGGQSIHAGDFGQGPASGAKTSCNNYLASNLSGLTFVGGAPVLNGPSPLGDITIGVRLQCQ
jgi:hypothetical protein